jgi:hypothetical protein
MKQLFLFFFIAVSPAIGAQDTVQQKIRVVGSRSINDFPLAASGSGKYIAHFSFTPSDDDPNLEIALWEPSSDTDSLFKTVLFHENLTKDEHSRVDLLVDQNGTQVNITSIMAGKMAVITPVKPQNGRILPLRFRSDPRIEGKNVPVVLLIDSEKEFAEKDLADLLAVQDIRLIRQQTVRELKKQVGTFKILSYHLKKQP